MPTVNLPTTTKLAALRAAWAAGDKAGALAIAARFANLGKHEWAICGQSLRKPETIRSQQGELPVQFDARPHLGTYWDAV
jgi:hypothetical protein